MTDENDPPLHSVRAKRIPNDSWVPAGLDLLPPGWVNVRIWSYDESLNRDLYVTEPCPGRLHFESTVTEEVIQYADPDGELFSQWGDPYDTQPVVVGTLAADPPHRHSQYVDPSWQQAYLGGGYIGTCQTDQVRALLAEHGFDEAIPRPDDGTPEGSAE